MILFLNVEGGGCTKSGMKSFMHSPLKYDMLSGFTLVDVLYKEDADKINAICLTHHCYRTEQDKFYTASKKAWGDYNLEQSDAVET